MSERRHRLARRLAWQRLAITAEQDALNCDDEALTHGHDDADPNLVRQHLQGMARELRKRIERWPV